MIPKDNDTCFWCVFQLIYKTFAFIMHKNLKHLLVYMFAVLTGLLKKKNQKVNLSGELLECNFLQLKVFA